MMTLILFAAALASSPVEGQHYLACGCGCGGGIDESQRRTVCFATQEELDEAIAKDKAWKDNPQCATMGASFGEYYAVCDPSQNEQ